MGDSFLIISWDDVLLAGLRRVPTESLHRGGSYLGRAGDQDSGRVGTGSIGYWRGTRGAPGRMLIFFLDLGGSYVGVSISW